MKRFVMVRCFRFLLTGLMVGSAVAGYAESFTKALRTYSVGPSPTMIAAQDLTGDGYPEIITSDRGSMTDPNDERPANDELSYLVSQGKLDYLREPPLRVGFAPYALCIANVDELKALDIVAASFLATRNWDLTLFRNLGDNLFEPHHFGVPDDELGYAKMRDGENMPVFTTPGLTSLVIQDINSDGLRDALATGWSSDVIVYFPGDREAYFGEARITQAPGGPRDLRTGDFDEDGDTDLAVALYSAGAIALWSGDKQGGFERVEQFSSRGRLPHKIRVADFDGDKHQDLAVSHCYADDSVVLFFGNGDFSFPMSQEICLGKKRDTIECEIRDLVVDDLDGDGRMDLAVACFESRQVVVLINTSEPGEFPLRFRTERYDFPEGQPRALCVADFDQDGKKDLGVALWGIDAVAVLQGK